jgi:hypothetical protein
MIKNKVDGVDELAEEDTPIDDATDGFDKMDEYRSVILDYMHPWHAAGDPSLSFQSMFQDGQDPLDLTQDPSPACGLVV